MLRSTLILLFLALTASASAKEFDYNYLSLSYGIIEFDDTSFDGDGFGLGGSYAINEDFHVFAGYQAVGLDFGIDATSFGAGLGYHTSLTPVVDLVASVSYQYVDFDAPAPFSGGDDNGFGLDLGLRFAASEELELNAGISYVDLSDSGDDTGFGVGGLYSFTDAFALGLSAAWSDDATSYALEGRFYFGR